MLKIDDLIGVRFTSHGRSRAEGFDCYGLAIEISKRLGRNLEDIWYEKASPETFTENYESVFSKVADKVELTDDLDFGNYIVFFDEKGNMVHIGVLLDDEVFIHADVGGVRITRLEDYYRRNWKVYKWLQ